jgi:hypothetical protein
LIECATRLAGSSLSEAEAAALERLLRTVADRTRLWILGILLRAEATPVCARLVANRARHRARRCSGAARDRHRRERPRSRARSTPKRSPAPTSPSPPATKCPVTPGVRRIRWDLPDPEHQPLEQVRPIRDEIRRQVEQLVVALDRETGRAAG